MRQLLPLMLFAALAQAEPSVVTPGWDGLPIRKEKHVEPPSDWIATKSAALAVQFALPCVAKEEPLQEAKMIVETYTCDAGDLLYVVIVSPLDVIEKPYRVSWPERFTQEQLRNLQTRAAAKGLTATVTPEYRVAFSNAGGVQARVDVSDRKVIMRALADGRAGVFMMVLSKGAEPREAARQLFSSLKLR